jgi:hypothetical protein
METFWRWFDRCARLDFFGNVVGYFFDWRGWLAAVAGGGGGAVTFLWAAIEGRSPLDVWVIAVVVAAALAMFFYFSLGVLQKLAATRKAFASVDPRDRTAVVAPHLSQDTSQDWSLRELFGYLAPHLPLTATKKDGHTSIGTKDERWEAIGDQVLEQLSIGRLHAIGVGYRNMTIRLQAAPIPAEFWRTAIFTYWF